MEAITFTTRDDEEFTVADDPQRSQRAYKSKELCSKITTAEQDSTEEQRLRARPSLAEKFYPQLLTTKSEVVVVSHSWYKNLPSPYD
ncbi:hypothetical protein Tco_1447449 [Tanacetum coccineum]